MSPGMGGGWCSTRTGTAAGRSTRCRRLGERRFSSPPIRRAPTAPPGRPTGTRSPSTPCVPAIEISTRWRPTDPGWSSAPAARRTSSTRRGRVTGTTWWREVIPAGEESGAASTFLAASTFILVPLDGGAARTIPVPGDFAHWSPTEDLIAFHSSEGLRVMSPDGASRLLVPNSPTGEEAFYAAWSPDGKTVYYVAKGPARLVDPGGAGDGWHLPAAGAIRRPRPPA